MFPTGRRPGVPGGQRATNLSQLVASQDGANLLSSSVMAAASLQRERAVLAALRRQNLASGLLQDSAVLRDVAPNTALISPLHSLVQNGIGAGLTDLTVAELREQGLSSDPLLVANAIAAERQARLAARAQQSALMSEAYKRGREEALLSLVRSGAVALPQQPTGVSVQPFASLPAATAAAAATASAAESASSRKKPTSYFDASKLSDPDPVTLSNRRARGGVTEPFPEKLHRMLRELEENGETEVVSFFPHGRAFAVHNPTRFVSEVMPKYFRQSRLSSFQRQLNLYGFTRITAGPDAGGYYHELFLKGRPALCVHMRRVGVPQGPPKGHSARGPSVEVSKFL